MKVRNLILDIQIYLKTVKKKKILSYEIEPNKFSLLTEKEFDNIYLMRPEAFTFDMSYIAKRKNPKYSFQYFRKLMGKFEATFDNFENLADSNKCNIFFEFF